MRGIARGSAAAAKEGSLTCRLANLREEKLDWSRLLDKHAGSWFT